MCANYLFFYHCYLLPPDACVWLQGNNVDGSACCLCVLIITNISVSLVIISIVSLKCFSVFEQFLFYRSVVIKLSAPTSMIQSHKHSFLDIKVVFERIVLMLLLEHFQGQVYVESNFLSFHLEFNWFSSFFAFIKLLFQRF